MSTTTPPFSPLIPPPGASLSWRVRFYRRYTHKGKGWRVWQGLLLALVQTVAIAAIIWMAWFYRGSIGKSVSWINSSVSSWSKTTVASKTSAATASTKKTDQKSTTSAAQTESDSSSDPVQTDSEDQALLDSVANNAPPEDGEGIEHVPPATAKPSPASSTTIAPKVTAVKPAPVKPLPTAVPTGESTEEVTSLESEIQQNNITIVAYELLLELPEGQTRKSIGSGGSLTELKSEIRRQEGVIQGYKIDRLVQVARLSKNR